MSFPPVPSTANHQLQPTASFRAANNSANTKTSVNREASANTETSTTAAAHPRPALSLYQPLVGMC